ANNHERSDREPGIPARSGAVGEGGAARPGAERREREDMSGSEWGAIIGAQICLVLVVVLVVMVVRLDRTTREMRAAASEFRRESGMALRELREALREANYELDR